MPTFTPLNPPPKHDPFSNFPNWRVIVSVEFSGAASAVSQLGTGVLVPRVGVEVEVEVGVGVEVGVQVEVGVGVEVEVGVGVKGGVGVGVEVGVGVGVEVGKRNDGYTVCCCCCC